MRQQLYEITACYNEPVLAMWLIQEAKLFNNAKCSTLTPEFVNTASGLELHQFKWLANDDLVGPLPHRWNHLVGYDAQNLDVSVVHYTAGGPYHKLTRDCEYAAEWFRERDDMLRAGGD